MDSAKTDTLRRRQVCNVGALPRSKVANICFSMHTLLMKIENSILQHSLCRPMHLECRQRDIKIAAQTDYNEAAAIAEAFYGTAPPSATGSRVFASREKKSRRAPALEKKRRGRSLQDLVMKTWKSAYMLCDVK